MDEDKEREVEARATLAIAGCSGISLFIVLLPILLFLGYFVWLLGGWPIALLLVAIGIAVLAFIFKPLL